MSILTGYSLWDIFLIFWAIIVSAIVTTLERKTLAPAPRPKGPSRYGIYGVVQLVADVLKSLTSAEYYYHLDRASRGNSHAYLRFILFGVAPPLLGSLLLIYATSFETLGPIPSHFLPMGLLCIGVVHQAFTLLGQFLTSRCSSFHHLAGIRPISEAIFLAALYPLTGSLGDLSHIIEVSIVTSLDPVVLATLILSILFTSTLAPPNHSEPCHPTKSVFIPSSVDLLISSLAHVPCTRFDQSSYALYSLAHLLIRPRY